MFWLWLCNNSNCIVLCACVLYSGLVKCALTVSHPCEPISISVNRDTTFGDEDGMAARSTIGQIQEFCPDSESFAAYVEQVELFFTANDIPAEKKVPVFLSVVWGLRTGYCVTCWRRPIPRTSRSTHFKHQFCF